MSTNSHQTNVSASRAPVASLMQRLSAVAWCANDSIDLPSVHLALKSCLAIVLATGLAFWLDISVTITAVTAFMIQQGYVGSTIYRGTLRFIGGTAGALIALVLLAFFSQNRILFIGSISLFTGVIVYFLQATRYWYAYILCLAALVVVGYGSIEHPQNSFNFAVTWSSGILLAVVVVSVVRGLLWPNLTADVFEKQLRSNFETCEKLVQLMLDSLVEGHDNRAEMDRPEQSLIRGLAQPQTTLQTAFFDSWQVDRFEGSYNRLIDQVTSMAHRIIEARENLRLYQARTGLSDVVHRSANLPKIAQQMNGQMQKLIAALEKPRDGTSRLRDLDQDKASLETLFNGLAEEFQKSGIDLLDKAVLFGLHQKLAQLGAHIPRLHQTLLNAETAEARAAARADTKSHPPAPPLKPRMIKALAGSILMIVVAYVWILSNWPLALHRVMVYTAVLACFNAMFPAIPRRAILHSLAFGIVGAAFMYFVILRPLEGFPELALALSLALFPCCYFVNSPNPMNMITGLFTGMIIIGLMDLSLQQSYSFSTFADNAIGYCGGFMIALVILQLFVTSTPEQTFRKNVLAFFHACEQSIDALSADPPWTEKGKLCLAAGQSQLVKTFKISGLWSKMLNPRQTTENDPKKVGQLLASMQSLIFRFELMEHARFQAPDDSDLATLASGEHGLRATLRKSLSVIQSTIQGDVVASEPPNADTTVQQVRRLLEPLRDHFSKDSTDGASAIGVLVLAGYYAALADAIDQCHEDVKALDWQRWQRSYI